MNDQNNAMGELPTPAQMLQRAQDALSRAYAALGDAGEELWSDWPPGMSMTDEQVAQRTRIVEAIKTAKAAINGAR